MPAEDSVLSEAAFLDARDIAEVLDHAFTDADLVQYKEMGVDLGQAAIFFVKTYQGSNNFMNSVLKQRLEQRGNLTGPQLVTALNIMREEHLGLSRKSSVKGLTCYTCGLDGFSTFDELTQHKVQLHGTQAPPETISEVGEAKAVLEVTTSVKGLDLSNLPDGRYAAPDPSGKHDYIFLAVRRVRKTVQRDRRYVYGKVVTGNEVVVAGTIEVREWSSDSKEWVGAQKPGDVYRGKYEDELELVMLMPEPWAILFGKILGYCCRCGKALTDEVSRAIGLGLECEKYLANKYFRQPPKYTFIGADRPDPEKANPDDEKYLTGAWKKFQKPPEKKSGITGGR